MIAETIDISIRSWLNKTIAEGIVGLTVFIVIILVAGIFFYLQDKNKK